jgi:hypothetical protein
MKQTEGEIKVFLASSSELDIERAHVGDLFNDINSVLMDTNVRVRLLKWESFDPGFKGNRKQSEYDEQVKKADIFIALFRTVFGKFTEEETKIAAISHEQEKKPGELYCFIQDNIQERQFTPEKIKESLGGSYIMDSFSDINNLKSKILRILLPHFRASGVEFAETEKFFRIGANKILRKSE